MPDQSIEYPPFPEIEGVRFALLPGHPGYCAGDDGTVWTCLERLKGSGRGGYGIGPNWKKLKPSNAKDGYPYHILSGGMGRSAHRLILEAFVGPRPFKMVCRHLNGDPTDNRLCNLAWGTYRENVNDARAHGTFRKPRGEEVGTSKLSADEVIRIRLLAGHGLSIPAIAGVFGISAGHAQSIVARRRWKHIP